MTLESYPLAGGGNLVAPRALDSRSTYFAQKPLHHATTADRGEAAAWLGPRLMFSLARDGFPDPLTPHLDRAALDVRSLALAAGEIDCRVHLAERVRAAL
jgi:hypothetical protein